jgi:transcription elongation factor Elf1
MAKIIRERIVEDTYDVCENCGKEFQYYEFDENKMAGIFKCNKCGKDYCSDCIQYMIFDFHTFKGCSGVSYEMKYNLQGQHGFTTCYNCGKEIKNQLEAMGLKYFKDEDFKVVQ